MPVICMPSTSGDMFWNVIIAMDLAYKIIIRLQLPEWHWQAAIMIMIGNDITCVEAQIARGTKHQTHCLE